jgi:site-specific DNA-methyltransferase (adenine-specific)
LIEFINKEYETDIYEIPDKKFDIAICDIPYGINVGKMAFLSETNCLVKQKNGTKLRTKNQIHTPKDWDEKVPTQEYFDELKRISKNQIIWGVNYVDWVGLETGRIKWDKGFAKGVSFNRYEYAYCSLINYEMELPLLWAGMCQAKSLREPMVQQGNKKLNEKRLHPCQKPILLSLKLLMLFAKEGMSIIDTHAGVFGMAIACDMFGCNFIGYEKDKEYFDKGVNRYNEYKKQLNLF